jgi:hypothetical protein
LHANSSKLTDTGAGALAGSPALPNLTFMDLLGCRLKAPGQRALLEAEQMGWVGFSEDDVRQKDLKELHQRRYHGEYWGYTLDSGDVYGD